MIVLQIYQKIQFKHISLTLGEGWQQCKGAQGGRGDEAKEDNTDYLHVLSVQ